MLRGAMFAISIHHIRVHWLQPGSSSLTGGRGLDSPWTHSTTGDYSTFRPASTSSSVRSMYLEPRPPACVEIIPCPTRPAPSRLLACLILRPIPTLKALQRELTSFVRMHHRR